MRIVKNLIAVWAFAVVAVTFAGADNISIIFSTKGPDSYKDGRKVLDGECYGLFWTPDGATFGGIAADGQVVSPSKMVLKAAIAKDGRCPPVLFQVDADYARTNYPGGIWNVCLLDTRHFATGADGVVQMGADGLPVVDSWGEGSSVVNGYGEAGPAVASSGVGSVGAADVRGVARVRTESALPASASGELKVCDIKVVDGNVYLTVSGTSSSLLYGLRTGKTPSVLLNDGQLRYGKTGEDLLIVTPANSEGEFFSVGEKR